MSVPGMNGSGMQVPQDIPWDEDNPPVLFNCSNMRFHENNCDKTCGEMEVTKAKVDLINEGLAFARAGMQWRGVPATLAGVLPINGIAVELFDILCWVELLRDKFLELIGTDISDFDEDFAIYKFNKMHELRMQAEETVKKKRLADQFGIVEKKVLGPDGQPI